MTIRKQMLAAQELELMKIVWRKGSATVRDVYEELLKHRKIAYTTVMTTMGILEQKGYLKRIEQGRAYLYKPIKSEQQVLGNMVQDLVKRAFGGSTKPLFVHLIEDTTDEELQELAKLLKERRKKQ